MADQTQPLETLREYVGRTKENHFSSGVADAEEDYGARINKTLHSLQNQIKQHQAALEKLRAKAPQESIDEPSQDPKSHLRQLHTITAAYKSLTSTEPTLPLPNSPLPALIALRSTLNTIDQTKASIAETNEEITKVRGRLRQEQDDLKDARELTKALEERIEKLRTEIEETSRKPLDERAQTMVQEQQEKRRHYVVETKKLVKAFNQFIDEHLAAMLAVEDLGGPVVGDLIDIDAETLKAGFTQTGKPKKAKGKSDTVEAGRKRRNNEIWGFKGSDSDSQSKGEKEAAAEDFRSLTEDLLNAAADIEDPNPYVDIKRESAAVRFLVRAKVARFHPQDARKLRLVDFGKELDEGACTRSKDKSF